ncbi:ABC transporter permease [Ohtaekwangia koreensis]|uniref:FtsX-like permease family protein n=1 Tax=Ohtaekwangia koreensis TaxID=688867 RepID=A0A1T5MFE6_9BACT|nr:ABC transporter permease [Ohtaekwangia koreensis]SKC86638.1 FtsX-like permease family protein [Ohtaekwangia koreensis]
MLYHHFLLLYRNFKRFKSTFFINLIGLSSGMACTLLIYLWIQDELNFDKFHENDGQLYQVMCNSENSEGIVTNEATPGILAKALQDEMPEVEHAVAAIAPAWYSESTLSVNDNNVKGTLLYAEKDFFSIFSYPLIQGNKNRVLEDKNSIVISEKLALKLFQTTDNVIGKTVDWQHDKQYIVSGIFADIPSNSSSQFDVILPFELFLADNPHLKEWTSVDPYTYLLLKKDVNIGQFESKISIFIKNKYKDSEITLSIRPYSQGYLYGKYENGVQTGGRIEYVKLFSIIAIFILVIACTNFMNLSTAKASRRIKEVGIQKAIGASRKILIRQYLGESLATTLVSLFIALVIVQLLLPQFNTITGKHLILDFSKDLLLSIAAITIFTALVSGSYPAFYLSGFNPATVLKGKVNASLGELWARKGLVVFQFALSVVFIVSVLVVYRQIEFVQNKNIGYSKDNALSFDMAGKVENILANTGTFLSEIKNLPGIVSASSMDNSIIGQFGSTDDISWEGKSPSDRIGFGNVGFNYDMIETLGMGLIAGRSFSRNVSTDSAEIIFNETAIRQMGLEDPIGKTVKMWGSERTVVGIVKDFHFESLHANVKPFAIRLEPLNTYKIVAKLKAGTEHETITQLQKLYQKYNPGFVFDYKFLDDNYQSQYIAEARIGVLSRYFAALAILISCLGLFALAAFTAERRSKEIGIRKVLGSSVVNIIVLLSGDFTKIVFAAIIIALPISYLIVRQWLDSFAFKVDLEWWYFIGTGILVLLITWLTVGSQAIRAARINPVHSLKDE